MGRLLVITLALLVITGREVSAMEEPWSVSGRAPVIDATFRGHEDKGHHVGGTNPFIILVKGFQRYISPVDGERCNMYPTCSSYSINAFKKHGSLKGIILTADRLLHEYDEAAFAPRIIKYGQLRYYDPVEYNDFWWSK